mmetsp:Transcript_34358/g.80292  ORF Transcript_34358/g.80292 Transcript_34358/m.80292 type:complete len:187 (-) Transcript_34358:40-600(-)
MHPGDSGPTIVPKRGGGGWRTVYFEISGDETLTLMVRALGVGKTIGPLENTSHNHFAVGVTTLDSQHSSSDSNLIGMDGISVGFNQRDCGVNKSGGRTTVQRFRDRKVPWRLGDTVQAHVARVEGQLCVSFEHNGDLIAEGRLPQHMHTYFGLTLWTPDAEYQLEQFPALELALGQALMTKSAARH